MPSPRTACNVSGSRGVSVDGSTCGSVIVRDDEPQALEVEGDQQAVWAPSSITASSSHHQQEGSASSGGFQPLPPFHDVVALIDAAVAPLPGGHHHLDTIEEAAEGQGLGGPKGGSSTKQKMGRSWDIAGLVLFIATLGVDAATAAVSSCPHCWCEIMENELHENRLAFYKVARSAHPCIFISTPLPQTLMGGSYGPALWAPALAFLCAPVVAMALILLVHNGWLALCMHWFALVLVRSDMRELRKVSPINDL